MKKLLTIAVCLLAASGICWLARAGDLEPQEGPAPTMVTLQQIYDKLDECTGGGLCGVAKTGQTGCWDVDGYPADCTGTGQDGEYQAGASVDPRFADHGDGTVTDNLTGLIWLQNANCFGLRTWFDALADANTLAGGSCGLTDGSAAGDWRLPNVRELQSLIDYGQCGPAFPAGHPFSGVQSYWYWSSTTNAEPMSSYHAWVVGLFNGDVNNDLKSEAYYVWPVRGGL